MSFNFERLKRFILFSTLLFIYTFPLNYYLYNINITRFQKFFFFISSVLSILYLCLCLCYRGFVDKKLLKNNSTQYLSSYCSICMQIKPERVHHCRQCRRCIKKMDHHCHWIGRCINYFNIGHFIRFMLFTAISTFFIIFFNIKYIYYIIYIRDDFLKISEAILCFFITFLSTLIFTIVVAHFSSQIYNACNNITGIEILKKESIGISKYNIYNSIYNLSLFENLKETFGSPYLLFLWIPQGDGINYRKNTDNKSFYDEDDLLFNDI